MIKAIRFDSGQFPQSPEMTWALFDAIMHPNPLENEFPYKHGFESVRTLPSEFILPKALYGDLLTALEQQKPNDLQQVEASQFIGIQQKSPLFTQTALIEGDERRISVKDEVRRILGKNSATLTFWHTHTEFKTPYPTPDDLSRSISFSDRAIVTMVGTPHYIWCLTKTKSVPRNTKTIREVIAEDSKLLREVDEIYDSNDRPPDFSALVKYLESLGYGLYVWFDKEGKKVAECAKENHFQSGIPLQRVFSDASSEIHLELRDHCQNYLPDPETVPVIPPERFVDFLGKITGFNKLISRLRKTFQGQ